METVRAVALCACGAAVTACVLRLLCPDGPMKRTFRAAAAAFLVCALLTVITRADFSAAAAELERTLSGSGVTSGEDLTDAFGEQVALRFARSLESRIGDSLAEAGLIPENIFVKASFDGEEGIHLEQITVAMPPDFRPREAEVKLCVLGVTGLSPEVYYAG